MKIRCVVGGLAAWLLGLVAVLGAGQAQAQVQVQCTVRVNDANPGAITFPYAPGVQVPASLSVTCPPDNPSNRDYRYFVELAVPTASALNLTSGLNTLSASVMTPAAAGCGSTEFSTQYKYPEDFSRTLAQHSWSVPFCLRMNTNTPLPAAGTYGGSFNLRVLRCRLNNRGSCTLAAVALTPTVQVQASVTVQVSCSVATAQNLVLNYQSAQTQPAVARGQACVVCNPGVQPTSVSVTPNSAVQLGLRYTLSSSSAVSNTAACTGTQVQYQAEMPALQWGRCTTAQCSSFEVHQLVVQY